MLTVSGLTRLRTPRFNQIHVAIHALINAVQPTTQALIGGATTAANGLPFQWQWDFVTELRQEQKVFSIWSYYKYLATNQSNVEALQLENIPVIFDYMTVDKINWQNSSYQPQIKNSNSLAKLFARLYEEGGLFWEA